MRTILDTDFKVGDLVEYEFRTGSGNIALAGLIISKSGPFGSDVWNVWGLDGEKYTIHSEYLKPINIKGKK